MKILFIWPNLSGFDCKPIGLSLLIAELKRAGHTVDLFDTTFINLGTTDYNQELTQRGFFKPVDYGCDVSKKNVDVLDELDKKIKEFEPDLFALSVLSDEAEVAKKIIFHLQDTHPGRILIGNKGAEKMRKEVGCIEGLVYFTGEAIGQISDIIKKKFYEKTNHFEAPGYFQDLDSLPHLDWSLFDPRHFLRAYDGKVYRSGDHMIGWGCTNSCTYCINEHWRELHGGMKGCMRRYSVDRIVYELQRLKHIWGLEFFKFHDEDMLLKPLEYFKELTEQYRDYVGLPFSCMTNAKSVTETRAKLLKEMGCVSVSIGIETGDPVMRNILNRRETSLDIISGVKILQENNIRVSAFNMIGLPWETELTINQTIHLNRAAGIKHPNVSFFIPLEGTRLYNISVAAGFYTPGQPVSTNRPTLKLPAISEKTLMWFYDNFHRLVTE